MAEEQGKLFDLTEEREKRERAKLPPYILNLGDRLQDAGFQQESLDLIELHKDYERLLNNYEGLLNPEAGA